MVYDDVTTYIVNIPFDLINDECYPLHAKTIFFFFTLVIVDSKIFD